MPKKSTHSTLFGVRLSPRERAQIETFAKEHGKSASEVARVLMRVGAVYAKPSDFGIQLDGIVTELEDVLQDIYTTCAGEQYGAAYSAACMAQAGIKAIREWGQEK